MYGHKTIGTGRCSMTGFLAHRKYYIRLNPLTPTVAISVLQLSSVLYQTGLSPSDQSARMSKITNDRLNPVWHRMLYSCTHMATWASKG